MAAPGFAQQFQRMLLSKLRVIFETAASELELWGKAAALQLEVQLRERRLGFVRRREALQRVQAASSELELRIAEVQAHDEQLDGMQLRLDELIGSILNRVQQQSGADLALAGSDRQDAA
jgi:hypothetical protein